MKTVLDSTTHKCSHEQIQFASTVAVKTSDWGPRPGFEKVGFGF